MNPMDSMIAQTYPHPQAGLPAQDQPAPLAPVFRSLMVVGLLGSVYGQRDDAQLVCSAVESTLQDPLEFRIHRSLAQAIGGDSRYACETISKHLEERPDDDASKVLLAVSMMLGGDAGWKPIIQGVLASSADQEARQAAMQVVGYLRTLS